MSLKTLFKNAIQACLVAALLSSCAEDKKADDEKKAATPPKIVTPSPREKGLVILSSTIPDGKGAFKQFGPKDVVNGNFSFDFTSASVQKGSKITAESEEKGAMTHGFFGNFPGIRFKVLPAAKVVVTLKDRQRSETVERAPDGEGVFAISLLAFKIFPPSFRERYTITVASVPGATSPFSFTYSVAARLSNIDPVQAIVTSGSETPRLGRDIKGVILARITPATKCDDCVIELESILSQADVRDFIELPLLPLPKGNRARVTEPKRFSGLVVKNKHPPCAPMPRAKEA